MEWPHFQLEGLLSPSVMNQFGGGAHGLVGATGASEMAVPIGRAEPSGCLSLLVLLH